MGHSTGDSIPRRGFFGRAGSLGLGAALPVMAGARGGPRPLPASAYPQNDPTRVQAVVGASHGNMERVRELVLEQPALAKASWDWGWGDWESALGAAAHTGRREIAEFLIAHGARPTIFSCAMMGQLPAVEAFLEADPELGRLHGPHGISLLRHAQAGGPDAQQVHDYLMERFGPDEGPFGVQGTDALQARYGGEYRFDTDPPMTLQVAVRNDWLMVGVGEQPTARVLSAGEDVFHPTGAPAVRIRFHVTGGRTTSVTIQDGPHDLSGSRIG